MNKVKILYVIIACLVAINVFQFVLYNMRHMLFTDAVPDEETALVIAKAVLSSAYGKHVLNQEPFAVTYICEGKYWYVCGNWPDDPNLVGGVASVNIRKSDGKILRLHHSL